ncbi:hypothetical protein BpHYR1_022612, partial [Brachionus plicatilis]
NEEIGPEKTKLCLIILSKYENLTIPLLSNLKSEWYFFTTDQTYLNQKKVKNFIKYLSEYQNDTFVCGHGSGFLTSRIDFLKS